MNDETIPLAPITPDATANDLTPRPRPKRITHLHALGMAIAASSRAILPISIGPMMRRNLSRTPRTRGPKNSLSTRTAAAVPSNWWATTATCPNG